VSAGTGTRRAPQWGELLDEMWPLAPRFGPLPEPTPDPEPDPYGNPDPEWLRVDWSRHLRSIELPAPEDRYGPPPEGFGRAGHTRINYVDYGSGEDRLDLVFVHGLGGCWQNWLENLPHFAPRHRVVALDLPGFGHSPLPPWEISIERYGSLLHDFCAALGIGDCAVIGNSMGGFISAEAAVREPERFEKLVLVSAAGVHQTTMRRWPAETLARMTTATAPLWLRIGERSMRRPTLRHHSFSGVFYNPSKLRTELLYECFHNGVHRPGFMPALRELIGYDILDQLEDVEVPTLIVWGRQDRIVPPRDAAEWGRRLRNSRTVIFERCGHVPMAERPVRFNRLLERFLAE
jgi:pimeloyl-ACP methyl ester carboxylesterase